MAETSGIVEKLSTRKAAMAALHSKSEAASETAMHSQSRLEEAKIQINRLKDQLAKVNNFLT